MDTHMNRRRFLELAAGTGAAALVGGSLADLSSQQIPTALAAPAARQIFDSAAASNWEDAFLSGNGRYGIMVYGNPLSETIIFNDHKFDQPNGTLGVQPPNLAGLVAQTRSDLLAGNYQTAENRFQNNWTFLWTQPFHPGYEMLLHLSSSGTISNYSRVLNFETGEITVQWSDGLGNWTRQSFVSRADNVVVQQLTAPSNGTLNLSIQLSAALSGAPSSLVTSNNVYTDSSGHTFLNMRVQYDSNPNDPGYEGVTWVVRSGGSQSINGTTLSISNATSVLLLTQLDRYAVSTTWNNQALQRALVTLPTSYSTLLSRHVAIHQPIYDRVTIDFNGNASDRALATTDLINKQLSSPSQLNPAFLERLFDAGRYHFLSSSGYYPPRLTGLWIGAWGAAWSDDFTTDANLNLQMAGATIGNMPEAVQAYYNMIFNLAPQWVTNSTNFYGISNGIFGTGRTDGISSYEIHFSTANPFQMWTGGADWILYPIYEYYQANGDTSFLQNSLWPWLEKLANFYVGFLTQKDSNGNYIFFPSYSPENAPGNTGVPACINATQDVAAGKHALQTAIAVANLLGLQQGPGGEVATWSALLKLLPPYRVNSDGALAEWIWPSLSDNYAHRHVSHLYPVWPLHDITPDTTPALASAAEVALLKRSNPENAAHGYLHRALAHARLKDGANVSAMLLQILANKSVFRSLMTSHYPNYNTYNADAAHAIPGILIEMLVDSQPGILEFLPALPDYLAQGTITGVVGRNRVTVTSLSWNLSSQTINATIVSAITQQITLISRRGINSISSSATLTSSSLGSFARVIALQAGVSTTISISIGGTPMSGGFYHLVNRNSGLVMDVNGASTSAGATIIQWPNNGGYNQEWSLQPTGDGYYYLVNRNSSLVMDVNGASTSAGATIIQWSNHSGTNQQWSLTPTGDGYYYLVNRNSGLVADVNGGSTSQGAQIIQWPNHGGTNQQWSLVQV
jgi:alpha-L-fucosidase 2